MMTSEPVEVALEPDIEAARRWENHYQYPHASMPMGEQL